MFVNEIKVLGIIGIKIEFVNEIKDLGTIGFKIDIVNENKVLGISGLTSFFPTQKCRDYRE